MSSFVFFVRRRITFLSIFFLGGGGMTELWIGSWDMIPQHRCKHIFQSALFFYVTMKPVVSECGVSQPVSHCMLISSEDRCRLPRDLEIGTNDPECHLHAIPVR